jgi:hypothetical protein
MRAVARRAASDQKRGDFMVFISDLRVLTVRERASFLTAGVAGFQKKGSCFACRYCGE